MHIVTTLRLIVGRATAAAGGVVAVAAATVVGVVAAATKAVGGGATATATVISVGAAAATKAVGVKAAAAQCRLVLLDEYTLRQHARVPRSEKLSVVECSCADALWCCGEMLGVRGD